jgi:hypothetical protein
MALPQLTKEADQIFGGPDYVSTMTDSNGARYAIAANMSCAARDVKLTSSLSGHLLDVESGETFAFGQPIPFRGGDGRIFEVVP